MPKFKITDAKDNVSTVTADTLEDAVKTIPTGQRNVYGIEYGGRCKFYLDRGEGGPLFPISVNAAAVELAMGGFD